MFTGVAVVVVELAIVLFMVFMMLAMFVLMCGPADEQISVGVVSAEEVIVMDCVGDVLELLSLDPV